MGGVRRPEYLSGPPTKDRKNQIIDDNTGDFKLKVPGLRVSIKTPNNQSPTMVSGSTPFSRSHRGQILSPDTVVKGTGWRRPSLHVGGIMWSLLVAPLPSLGPQTTRWGGTTPLTRRRGPWSRKAQRTPNRNVVGETTTVLRCLR